MGQLTVSRLQDTLIGWFEEQRPVFETVINQYLVGRRLTLFFGRRKVIPDLSIPSIEVAASTDGTKWRFVRVQSDVSRLDVDVTVDIGNQPELANRCINDLVSLVQRTLAAPQHIQGHIDQTADYLVNSLPGDAAYETINEGRIRVARLTWDGERLVHLVNQMFPTPMQVPQPLIFPPN